MMKYANVEFANSTSQCSGKQGPAALTNMSEEKSDQLRLDNPEQVQ